MDLSIILPKLNSKQTALASLASLRAYLANKKLSWEIILVDDGSRPEERLTVKEAGAGVRLLQLESNMGKGSAVRQGMSVASGECCIFTDIDLPYDLAAIPYAYRLIKNGGFDCVAGDRALAYSVDVASRPLVRKFASRIFSRGVALLVIGSIFDSQCGFKAFSRRLAKSIFPLLTIKGFSFDVELYYLLLKYNIAIRRIPVRLQNHNASTVSVLRHLWGMTFEVLGIPFKWYRGKYVSSELYNFYHEDRYWQEKE